ncbi:MAG: site-specific integrase [Oscillospiraceae bacterium]
MQANRTSRARKRKTPSAKSRFRRMPSICWSQSTRKHPSSPWMFPSPKTGEMYHPDSVVNIHKKILKDAGLEHLRFHDLRHTFATLALQNGVDVKTVSSMLGHFDAGFTLRTYTHVTRQMQESAAEKMGNFMAQVM